jgi:predicted aconitase
MSAKAEAEAAAALRELGATLKASTNAPKLHTGLHTPEAPQRDNELGLDEEEDELELSMMEELATLVKNADGPAGEKVKHRGKPGLYLYILPVQYRSVVTTKL